MKNSKIFPAFFLILLSPLSLLALNEEPAKETKNYDYASVMAKRKKEKEEVAYKQVFSFYPIKAFSNYMMVGYEKQIGPKCALKVVAGYVNFEEQSLSSNFDFDIKDFSGFRFELMLKYFIGSNNPVFNGAYFSPFVSFKNSKFQYRNLNTFDPDFNEVWEEGSANSVTAGFVVGYQIPMGENFSLDLFVGDALKRSSGNYLQANRIMDTYKNSIGIISGLSVGFGF